MGFSLGKCRCRGRTRRRPHCSQRDAGDRWVRLAVFSSLAEGAADVLAMSAGDATFRETAAGRDAIEQLALLIGTQAKNENVAAVLQLLGSIPASDKPLAAGILPGTGRRAGENGGTAPRPDLRNGRTGGTLLRELVVSALANSQDEKRPLAERGMPSARWGWGLSLTAVRRWQRCWGAGSRRSCNWRRFRACPLHGARRLRRAAGGLADVDSQSAEHGDRSGVLSTSMAGGVSGGRGPRRGSTVGRRTGADQAAGVARRSGDQPGGAEHRRHNEARETPGCAGRVSAVAGAGRRCRQGTAIFQKICANCHRLENVGFEIGPNLATIKNRGADAILLNVLDPNREVNPQYVNYVIVTEDGKSLTGMIAAETATSVTLKRQENATDTVLRVNIDEMRSTGMSIMPEGMEKQIDQQAMGT